MKCISIKFALLILIALLLISSINSLRSKIKTISNSRTHVISKYKNKLRERKEELKATKFELKDGPLSWEELTEQAFQSLMKTQIQAMPEDNRNSSHLEPRKNSIFTNTPNQSSSENTTRSKTFRTVSPNDDTTVNLQGQKYSNIFKINNSRNVKSGFMGRTRLTRL